VSRRAVFPGRELPPLVELAVVWEVRLRDDAPDAALADHDRAVVEEVIDLERQADHGHDRQDLGGGRDLAERLEAPVEQHPLLKEILARVRGQPELGKEEEDRVLLRRSTHRLDRLAGVEARVRDAHLRRRHSDPDEIVAVETEEALARSHGAARASRVGPDRAGDFGAATDRGASGSRTRRRGSARTTERSGTANQ